LQAPEVARVSISRSVRSPRRPAAAGLLVTFEGEMSFPRRRESSGEDAGEVRKMDPRLRGDDKMCAGMTT